MSKPLFLCFFTICAVCVSAGAEHEQVTEGQVQLTPEITLTGEKYSCVKDPTKHAYVYYGIRYGVAKRFEHAELNKDYSYLTNPARPKGGNVCPQHLFQFPGFPPRNLTMDEDCLYLDVYVPPQDKTKKLPVLFFIHGGGFQIGDKDMYNATDLAFATEAIVVTINYRVFLWGFLSTGDGGIKGNYGIGDAKAAFHWVEKNIAKFGGDPKAITIFGESAGGSLTSAVFLDEHIRQNVRAAVAMSGSILSVWSLNRYANFGVTTVANLLGCPNETQAKIQCLKDAPMDRLLNVTQGVAKNMSMWFMFAPVIDGDHITEPPAQMILKQKKSNDEREGNFITGFLREDSSFLMMLSNKDLFLPNSTFGYAAARKLVTENAGLIQPCNITATVDEILHQYNLTDKDDPEAIRFKAYHILTDLTFGIPAITEARLYANRSFSSEVPNQMYRISYDPKYSNLGSFHGLDLVLSFAGPLRLLLANHTVDDQIIHNFRELFRQVAHNGRVDGPIVGPEGKYVEFGQSGKWEVGTDNFNDVSVFWSNQFELARSCAASQSRDIVKLLR